MIKLDEQTLKLKYRDKKKRMLQFRIPVISFNFICVINIYLCDMYFLMENTYFSWD